MLQISNIHHHHSTLYIIQKFKNFIVLNFFSEIIKLINIYYNLLFLISVYMFYLKNKKIEINVTVNIIGYLSNINLRRFDNRSCLRRTLYKNVQIFLLKFLFPFRCDVKHIIVGR
jgi:hypothetical protein